MDSEKNIAAAAVALPQPYPEVANGQDDAYIARMLKQDMSGDISELTAICTYQYQQLICCKEYAEMARVIRQIARVEMHHLDLLGQAIVTLGEKPVYSSYGIYWSATNVSDQEEPKRFLKQNIQNEKNAIAQYWRHIQKTRNKSARWLLERIIRDEELHMRLFEKMLCALEN